MKNMCSAMIKANITDPDSQEGIDFCTQQCPYADEDECILYRTAKSKEDTDEHKS